MLYPDLKIAAQRITMVIFLIAMLILSVVALGITADDPAAEQEPVEAGTSAEADAETYIQDGVNQLEISAGAVPITAVEEDEFITDEHTENMDISDPNTVTLSFVGDCMLATMLGSEAFGTFNALANSVEPEYFFSEMADIFMKDDWTIANCENVFTDNDLTAAYKNYSPAYWYKSKSENAYIFKAGGVDIVSLANNHSKDYGEQGRTDTIAALEKAEVDWGDNEKPIILEKSGVKIALLCTTFYYSGYESNIITWIKEIKKEVDFIIIYYHGGTERQHVPDSWRVSASKKMIDAGADLIVGNHPHVLQPAEEYKGGYIIHSLGNFVFGGSKYPENRTVIFQIKLNLSEEKIISHEYSLIPCYVYTDPWKPAIIQNKSEIDQVLNFMQGKTSSPIG